MKPLLVIPPASNRWESLETLLTSIEPARLSDLRQRFHEPGAGAGDAFAIIPNGSLTLAFACVRRCGELGVLGELFTRPDHRLRGLARGLLQTLLSWFDMTGGKWLYLNSPAELSSAIFENFGFQPLRRANDAGGPRVTMLRHLSHVAESPYIDAIGELAVDRVTEADWPAMVAMLQHFPGPDPRAPIEETAVSAELFASDLLRQQRENRCALLAARRGGRLLGVGSLAVDQLGTKSYAMTMPHDSAPAELTAAIQEFARGKGYEQVDFPLMALAKG